MFALCILLAGLLALLTLLLFQVYLPYFGQDLRFVVGLLTTGFRSAVKNKRRAPVTVLDLFLDNVAKRPHKAFLVFEDQVLTYLDVDKRSNKLARVLQTQAGLEQGTTVAMLIGNEPDFVCVWLALAKLGCPAAFLNYNIRSKSLVHCFQSSDAQVLVAGSDLRSSVEEVLPDLKAGEVAVYILDDKCTNDGIESLHQHIDRASDSPLPLALRSNVTLNSNFMYIYTSGTTGLPKAAIINHARAVLAASFLSLYRISADDVVYVTLPLYHSSGSLFGICGSIHQGTTVVLRRKFSSSQFWADCRKYNVTVIQYIGEIIRYLCNVPKRDNDRDHKVRIAMGNGLRPDVWRKFLDRFGDIRVCEFYGATEGNIGFLNYVGKIGASGRTCCVLRKIMPFNLIKFDHEKEEPFRDANGRCIEVARGEAGLLIAEITRKHPFVGYAGHRKLTEKKRLHDVFRKGDEYFNSGDLLSLDSENFIYFQDRVGDTFRWKGENVATTEVADILALVDFIQEVCVYGVTVPEHEGRIGMVAVKLEDGRELEGEILYNHVVNHLPNYARPRFLRLQKNIEITGTFKQRKVRLVEEGFNPMTVQNPLFFLDDKKKCYTSMDQGIYDSIVSKQIKL